MIQLLYIGVLGLVFLYFLQLLFTSTRRAIIAGLTFTTLALPAISWQFIDIPSFGVALNFAFIGAAFVVTTVKKRFRVKPIFNHYNVLLYVFGFLLLAYTIISDAQEYGLSKSGFFFMKIIIPMIAFSMLAPFSEAEKKTVIITLVVAAILTTLSLFSYSSFNPNGLYERATVGEKLNPITVSRTIGYGTVLLFLFGFNFRSGKFLFLATGFLAVFTILGVVATGSRGPLFAAAVASVLSLLTLNVSLGSSLRTFSKLTVVGLGIVGIVYASDIESKLEHMGGYRRIAYYLTEAGSNTSDLERVRRLNVAWDGMIESKGAGIGTGGFASLYGYEFREYPHNLPLEVGLEIGVLGLLVLFGILGAVTVTTYKTRRLAKSSFYVQGLFGLWLYSLFNSMVSTDVNGNQALWIFGGLLILFTMEIGKKQKAGEMAQPKGKR